MWSEKKVDGRDWVGGTEVYEVKKKKKIIKESRDVKRVERKFLQIVPIYIG